MGSPGLEELVVVGGEGIGHKILADVAVRGLVEIGVGKFSLAAYVGGPGPGRDDRHRRALKLPTLWCGR